MDKVLKPSNSMKYNVQKHNNFIKEKDGNNNCENNNNGDNRLYVQ
jgi:hypothetical protein